MKIDLRECPSADNINKYTQDLEDMIFTDSFSKDKLQKIEFIDTNGDVINLEAKNVLISLIFYKHLFNVMEQRFLITELYRDETVEYMDKYMNAMLTTLSHHYMNNDEKLYEIKYGFSQIIEELGRIAVKSNETKGATINLHSLIKLSKENEELKSLLNFKIPDNLQFSDIESMIKYNLGRLTDILRSEDTPYKDIINSGGINIKQMGQALMSVGLKPNLFGKQRCRLKISASCPL